MDPREAQRRTEVRWLAIIDVQQDDLPMCGWCLFAMAMTTKDMSQCHNCPVVRVFGDSCNNIQDFDEWAQTGEADLAGKVYELLIAHRDQLIAAAKEIENEQAVRD